MLPGLSSYALRNPIIWRTTSYESVLCQSPPKSFAEEVANELSNRAKALGSSHPSVVIGKQKRLMDGLMDVADTIRKDFPKAEKDRVISATRKSDFLTPKTTDVTDAYGTNAFLNTDGNNRDRQMKQNITEQLDVLNSVENRLKGAKVNDYEDKEEVNVKTTETSLSENILTETEPTSIHIRLVQDHIENNDASWQEKKIWPEGDTNYSCLTTNRKAPPKPQRKRKTKQSAWIIRFFQSKSKKKSKTEKKMKLRDRIAALMNNNTMRNIRKNLRRIWTPKNAAENKLTQFKTNILRMSMI